MWRVLMVLCVVGCTVAPTDPSGLRQYYAAIDAQSAAVGGLRQDRAPADAPFDGGDLVRAFEAIAFSDEHRIAKGRLSAAPDMGRLQRWRGPVRVEVIPGASVLTADAADFRGEVRATLPLLSRATGLSIRTARRGTLQIALLDRADRVAGLPGVSPAIAQHLAAFHPRILCITYPLTEGDRITGALIVVKAEHGPARRAACVEEELAQALGLRNDARVRPSVFNDDDEFARLTRHDLALLHMLYDPRLRPGMTLADARPMLAQIAADALSAGR